MKKSEFDYQPSLMEQEGNVVRINFDAEQVDKEVPAEDGGQPVIRKVWEAYVVRVEEPLTRSRIVDATVNAGYPRDKMDAVINNYLLNQKDAEAKQEFNDMQAWRQRAKQLADEVQSVVGES